MEKNFWKDLKDPVFTLAPMEDVTDTVFREIIVNEASSGYLKVVMSEFTSTDGLLHEVGGPKVKHRLQINDSERKILKENGIKIVAQIWGSDPEKFYKSAKSISEDYEFDGIDINMGCPVRKIIKQGSCSMLIGQPELAKDIINACKEGSEIPVSVKTRIGLKKLDTENWISNLLETKPAAITIHGRIQKQMYSGEADWSEIAKAVKLRDEMGSETMIYGNGDVFDLQTGLKNIRNYGVDGVMVGRGIIGNPWFFSEVGRDRSPEDKLMLLWKHAKLFTDTWTGEKNFAILKRFFKAYTNGFSDAAIIRGQLMQASNIDEVKLVLNNCIYKIKI